jgi:TolA-binding protein
VIVRKFARSLFVPAAALALAACASQADMEQIQRNELQLRSMIAEDRQQIQQLQDRLSQNENLVKEMGQGGPPTRGGSRATNRRLSNIEQRLTRLESTVNRSAATGAIAPMPGAPGEGIAAAPAMPSAAVPGPAAAPAVPEAAAAAAPAVAAPAADLSAVLNQEMGRARSASGADGKIYAAGVDAMRQGRYAAATQQFALLKKRFPKSALNEPGQYFSAIALYQQGKFDESILQFNDLAMRYPKGRFTDSALLYEARAFLKTDDKIDARLTLQKLIADHGDSPQASSARALMKSLESD